MADNTSVIRLVGKKIGSEPITVVADERLLAVEDAEYQSCTGGKISQPEALRRFHDGQRIRIGLFIVEKA